jgi:hypothetical protein
VPIHKKLIFFIFLMVIKAAESRIGNYLPKIPAVGNCFSHLRGLMSLLVAETVLISAIGALPGDAVARHAPEILIHADLAD